MGWSVDGDVYLGGDPRKHLEGSEADEEVTEPVQEHWCAGDNFGQWGPLLEDPWGLKGKRAGECLEPLACIGVIRAGEL